MSLYDVLDQVINLLQQRGRVSYRALKREFNLDDDFIEDLKEEISYVHESAVKADDRGFTWAGETETTPKPTSQPDKTPSPEPQPVVEQAESTPVESTPVEPQPPDAERRQLTVMFCDLVGSTELSGQLDAEDYREVVKAYQSACTDVTRRYDGHIAQLLGDGLLIYFGYPQAHEDDAQRAIHSGLGMLDAIKQLNVDLEQTKGVKLEARLGIHTGLVVIGEMGGEGRHEQLALGEVPNVAARIQGLAEPDTLVISDATHQLIRGYFHCQERSEQSLRGVAEPVGIYRVLSESGVHSRLEIASPYGLTPLVGRDAEVRLLLERWEQVRDGQGQVMLVSGEAGIGKSRLVEGLKAHVADEFHGQEECWCSPYYTNSAFYPLADLLQRKLGWQSTDSADEKLHKLEMVLARTHLDVSTAVPLFTTLLALPLPEERYPSLPLSSQQQRQQTLEAFLQFVLLAADQHPVLFIVEDLQWVDPSTSEFLELLIDQTPTASLFVLLTCRPEFQPTWSHRSYLTEVSLHRLSRPQIEQIVTQVANGKALPADVIEQIVDKTDGVPLYVEEMTKSILESGILKEGKSHYELSGPISSLSIPATLQDSLMSRLDRLMTAKVVAQLGATIGRQFEYELLCTVAQLDEPILKRELGRLVEAELVYQRGLSPHSTYVFKHALIQDIAYGSLLRSTRQGYHRRIAAVLEERFPATAETQPELLAHHYKEAGLNEQAVDYWQQAGERAIQRSAHSESISHLNKAITLLSTLPDASERRAQELALHLDLGASLTFTQGFAATEGERAYARARELCRHVEDTPQFFLALRGLYTFHLLRAELKIAWELAEQLFNVSKRQQNATLVQQSHVLMGNTLFWLGEMTSARLQLEEGINIYHAQQPKYPDGSSEPFSRECAMIYQGISVAKMCQNIWSGT